MESHACRTWSVGPLTPLRNKNLPGIPTPSPGLCPWISRSPLCPPLTNCLPLYGTWHASAFSPLPPSNPAFRRVCYQVTTSISLFFLHETRSVCYRTRSFCSQVTDPRPQKQRWGSFGAMWCEGQTWNRKVRSPAWLCHQFPL